MLPLAHRVSHARSCALHVSQKLSLKRDPLIDSGVELHHVVTEQELLDAMAVLERIRMGELGPV